MSCKLSCKPVPSPCVQDDTFTGTDPVPAIADHHSIQFKKKDPSDNNIIIPIFNIFVARFTVCIVTVINSCCVKILRYTLKKATV